MRISPNLQTSQCCCSIWTGHHELALGNTALVHPFAMTRFDMWKTLHVLGVILLVGNVTATSIWKVFADRTKDPRVIAFAQRLVTITDLSLTVPGIVLIVLGGFRTAATAGIRPFSAAWLQISEALFVAAGLIWLVVLVPIQVRQSNSARIFATEQSVPAAYLRDARRWLWWGIIATALLLVAVAIMIGKP